MNPARARLTRSARTLALALGILVAAHASASAQFLGAGYGGMGYGGMGYGGIGGFGGYGGYGGYGGLGYGGYGGFNAVSYGGYGLVMPGYIGTDFTGLGPTGIGWRNPMFGVGLSPLGVQSMIFERAVLGRGAPTTVARPAPDPQAVTRSTASAPVGMGTFSAPR